MELFSNLDNVNERIPCQIETDELGLILMNFDGLIYSPDLKYGYNVITSTELYHWNVNGPYIQTLDGRYLYIYNGILQLSATPKHLLLLKHINIFEQKQTHSYDSNDKYITIDEYFNTIAQHINDSKFKGHFLKISNTEYFDRLDRKSVV